MRLPPSENLSTETLARVFRNTTNSYKFYWFLCILSHVSEHQKPQICIQDLLAQMVAKIWYPVNYFYISFGKQDRLGQVAEGIKLACGLANDVKADEIILATEAFVKEPSNDVTKALSTLARYVPYRFLRPWFTAELRGLPDHVINPKIRELAMARFNREIVPCLYKFSGQAATIEIHPRWHDYLLRNNRILQDFCLWNLADYLEKRNPNVPSVGKKLFKPSHRNLVQAKNFGTRFSEVVPSNVSIQMFR